MPSSSLKDLTKLIPVFVFLDENIPLVKEKTFEGLISSHGSKVRVIYCPKNFRSLGILDFFVISWARKVILSGQHHIKDALFDGPEPFFIFVTTDEKFVGEVKKEITFLKEHFPKRKDLEKFSFISSNLIYFKRGDREISLHVCNLHQNKGRKNQLISNMIQAVREILISYPSAS